MDFVASWKASWSAGGAPRQIPARLKRLAGNHWQSNFVLDLPKLESNCDELVLQIATACTEAWYLSPERQFRRVRGRVLTPRPIGRFAVVRTPAGLYRLELFGTPGLEIIERSGGIDILAPIVEKRRCGLSLWGPNKLSAPIDVAPVHFSVSYLEGLNECAWVEPYPNAARAVICLTDHADFDSTDKMELLADVFARYHFRCTKSVFPGGSEFNSSYGPSLDDNPYRKIITKLYDQGSEICFHGFGAARNAPPIEECIRRAETAMEFKPTTWIDHGTGRYLFSREAHLSEGAPLAELLSNFGVQNFWSYMDIWDNPLRHTGSWSPQHRPVVTEFLAGVSTMSSRSLDKIAYLVMHGLKNVVGEELVAVVRSRAYSPKRWKDALELRRQLSAVRDTPMLIYGLDGASFAANIWQPWVFDSTLLNHLSLQLSPTCVDHLARLSETLIGHCYFGAQHTYGFDNCFVGDARRPRLIPEFERNLAYIAARQLEGKVVTLSFARLRSSLAAFARTKLARFDGGWRVLFAEGDAPIMVGLPLSASHRIRCDAAIRHAREGALYLLAPKHGAYDIELDPSDRVPSGP